MYIDTVSEIAQARYKMLPSLTTNKKNKPGPVGTILQKQLQ